ncbi:MAG: FliH/SctL family protein [Acidimicrobiia bacterium]
MSSSCDLAPATIGGDPWIPAAIVDRSAPGPAEPDPEVVAPLLAAARAEGRAAGLAEGRREARAGIAAARADAERAVADLAAALDRALTGLAAHRALAAADLGRAVAEAALELAEAVVGRELALSTDPGRDALVRALRVVAPPAAVVAHLHPDDAATLGDAGLAVVPEGVELTVVADPAVDRGDCRLTVDDGAVDASIGAALARARAVLLDEGPW